MNFTKSVPKSHITINDPEPGAEHDADSARPSHENKLKFAKFPTGKPSVIVDIDDEGIAHSYATVFAVKIYNENLETVSISRKETDDVKEWTVVYNGTIPSDGTIMLPEGEQMGKIKIVPETGSETHMNEWLVFNFDVAVCKYGSGEYYLIVILRYRQWATIIGLNCRFLQEWCIRSHHTRQS